MGAKLELQYLLPEPFFFPVSDFKEIDAPGPEGGVQVKRVYTF